MRIRTKRLGISRTQRSYSQWTKPANNRTEGNLNLFACKHPLNIQKNRPSVEIRIQRLRTLTNKYFPIPVSSCRWDEQSVCDQHKGESQRLWEMWARQKKNNNQKWEKNQTIKPDRKQKTTNNIIQLYCNVWQTEWRLQKAVMRARQTNRKTNKLHLRTKMAIRCPGGRGWLRQWSLGGNLLFQRCSQSFFHCQDHAQKWYIYEQMLYLGNAITAKKTTKVKSSCLTHKENSKMLRGFGTGFIEMLLVNV